MRKLIRVLGVIACGLPAGGDEPAVSPQQAALPPDLVAGAGAVYADPEGLAPGSGQAQERQRSFSERTGLPLEVRTARTGILLRLVPPGTFTMGSPATEAGRDDDEGPQREVTQGEWEAVMGTNPSDFKEVGRDAPVEQVSWNDCQEFLNRLCDLEGVPRGTYRLLTEAQWEYACRAGTRGKYCTGETDADLARARWYWGNSGETTHAVGQKAANAWGLHDMHGNVWEWVQDEWHDSYEGTPRNGVAWEAGPSSGSVRVLRGWGPSPRVPRARRRAPRRQVCPCPGPAPGTKRP